MKVAIGCDHAGFTQKPAVLDFLYKNQYLVTDYGTYSPESVDYPDFAHCVASDIARGNSELGILLCGSGNGVAITANKHPNIRAALCWNAEIARLARAHNDANILALPARFVSAEEVFEILESFFNTKFEGGRHERRVHAINC